MSCKFSIFWRIRALRSRGRVAAGRREARPRACGSESGTGIIAVSGTSPSGRRPVSDDGASALSDDRRVIKSRTIHSTRCWASSEVPRSAVHATANGYKRPTGARASGRARHEWAGARKNNRRIPWESERRAPVGPRSPKPAQRRRHGQGHSVKVGGKHELHEGTRRGAA